MNDWQRDPGRTAVLVSAVRTPIGRFLGGLAPVSAAELGAIAIREAVRRAGIDGEEVEEVVMGNVVQAGVGQAPARQAALRAGLPPTVSALTINKVCGSGLKAVMLAAQAIRAGDVDQATWDKVHRILSKSPRKRAAKPRLRPFRTNPTDRYECEYCSLHTTIRGLPATLPAISYIGLHWR